MKVFLATDHAGFKLKEKVKEYLRNKGYTIEDCGAHTFDKNDDYPDFIAKAAHSVSRDPENSRGIIFGGSGQAEAITANKYKNIRCALIYSPAYPITDADILGRKSTDPFEIVRLSREHNDTNMLSLGARFLTEEQVYQIIEVWLSTAFSNDERHARRHQKISDIETHQ